jgi:NAD(P)-dependent dehydrogenase (short-subunit alcohol dehydrogenase family)
MMRAAGFRSTALVTGAGAAEGIGFAIARTLCRSGVSVAITGASKRVEFRAKPVSMYAHSSLTSVLRLKCVGCCRPQARSTSW